MFKKGSLFTIDESKKEKKVQKIARTILTSGGVFAMVAFAMVSFSSLPEENSQKGFLSASMIEENLKASPSEYEKCVEENINLEFSDHELEVLCTPDRQMLPQ